MVFNSAFYTLPHLAFYTLPHLHISGSTSLRMFKPCHWCHQENKPETAGTLWHDDDPAPCSQVFLVTPTKMVVLNGCMMCFFFFGNFKMNEEFLKLGFVEVVQWHLKVCRCSQCPSFMRLPRIGQFTFPFQTSFPFQTKGFCSMLHAHEQQSLLGTHVSLASSLDGWGFAMLWVLRGTTSILVAWVTHPEGFTFEVAKQIWKWSLPVGNTIGC